MDRGARRVRVSPWGRKESDMTKQLSTAQHIIYEIDAKILKKNLGNQL